MNEFGLFGDLVRKLTDRVECQIEDNSWVIEYKKCNNKKCSKNESIIIIQKFRIGKLIVLSLDCIPTIIDFYRGTLSN